MRVRDQKCPLQFNTPDQWLDEEKYYTGRDFDEKIFLYFFHKNVYYVTIVSLHQIHNT